MLLIGTLALCLFGALLGSTQSAQGQLRWDGEHWHWLGAQDHTVTQLHCVLDMQRLLLVHIRCEADTKLWLWLHSPVMDGRWRALRRSVVAAGKRLHLPASDSLPE